MEILVFAIAISIVAILGISRVRRGGSAEEPTPASADGFDDQRYRSAFPDDPVVMGVVPQRPVSRESGHGKDGGG